MPTAPAAPAKPADSTAPAPLNPRVAAPEAAAAATPADLATDFTRYFQAGMYAEAVATGQKILAHAEEQAKSPEDEAVQVALMNLALAQYYAGDYTAAEANYLRAIDAAEKSGRPLSNRIARANAGLAGAYYADKRYDIAVERFDKAIALSRRHEGLLNPQQISMLEKYADALTQLGRYQDALQAHKYMLRIETRMYGENDPRLAASLERVGRWYARVGAYDQSRRVLKHALDIVVNAEGENSSNLIGPLSALADCDRKQLLDPTLATVSSSPDSDRASLFHDDTGMMPPQVSSGMLLAEGEKALLRAATLADARKDRSDVQIADVRTQLGDWFQIRGQFDRALPNYQQAWQAAAKVTQRYAGKALTQLLFGEPVLLMIERPEGWNRYAGHKPERIETRFVTAALMVDEHGKPQNVRITEDSGDAKRAQRTLQSLQGARYRPRLEDGKPVITSNVAFSQPWMLLIEQTPANASASAGADAGSKKKGD
jgi:tetratricopeptide (TPR) repeat protein